MVWSLGFGAESSRGSRITNPLLAALLMPAISDAQTAPKGGGGGTGQQKKLERRLLLQ